MPRRKPLPLPDLYDRPYYGDLASTEYGQIWGAQVDALLPTMPTDFLTLFRIIGPDGPWGDKKAEAEQNKRVAALLGVTVRSAQRYRKLATGERGPKTQVRGGSPRRFREIYNQLAPLAWRMILARWCTFGLGVHAEWWLSISPKKDKPARKMNFDAGADAEIMQEYIQPPMAQRDADTAAEEFVLAVLGDYGIPEAVVVEAVDLDDEDAGFEIDVLELTLGYPDPPDIDTEDAETWWYDEDRARLTIPEDRPQEWSIE